jgi:anhydro-N-acetylmuramic acid kinase
MMDFYKVIGIMSGTSLDGIDIAYAEFKSDGLKWKFALKQQETKKFSLLWQQKLKNAMHASAEEYAQADVDLGNLMAAHIKKFIKSHSLSPDFISSHGLTIFHQPEKKLTTQIGNGAAIAAVTGLPTICDFRTTDVFKNGQGAPLVPIGDRLLFNNYRFCLNLGGIANISYERKNERIAFDICPVNMALNFLAAESSKKYDRDGNGAKAGNINKELLKNLNELAFYKKASPKSLGAEWFEKLFKPLIDKKPISTNDKLATVVEHICIQLYHVLLKAGSSGKDQMLVTGGGTFNKFLIKKMKDSLPVTLVIPDKNLISFKEALIFAFLGVLRWRKQINTLASVTGAESDSCSGAVFLP